MSDAAARKRFTNIHVTQIIRYRLPASGMVSILHRISGALMFLLLPFVLFLFDKSITSEISFEFFSIRFQRISDFNQLFLALGKLLFELCLRDLGSVGFSENAVGVDKTYPELLRV